MFDTHDAPETLPPSVVSALREGSRPARGRAAAVASIMAAVHESPAPTLTAAARSRRLTLRPMRPRWALRRGVLSPAGAALAACLTMAIGWLGALGGVRTAAPGAHGPRAGSPANASVLQRGGAALRDSILDNALVLAIRDSLRVVRFVLDAPAASRVALVGDFTAWRAAEVPLRRSRDGWTTDVAVPAGRHRYAFVVNDTQWVQSGRAAGALRAGIAGMADSVLVPTARFVGDTI